MPRLRFVSHVWNEEGKRRRARAIREGLCVDCDKPLPGRRIYYCSGKCQSKFFKKYWRVDDWEEIRKQALERDNFMCVKCEAPAEEVDHIIEIAVGGAEFDLDNTQSLCKPCHKEKTREFNRRRFTTTNIL